MTVINLEAMPHVHEVPEGQAVAYLGDVEEAPLVILTIADAVTDSVTGIALDEAKARELAQVLVEGADRLAARSGS